MTDTLTTPLDNTNSEKRLTKLTYETLSYSERINQWRVFPRLFLGAYIVAFYRMIDWFISLPDPNMAQAGFVSTVVGAGAAWFGLYVNSSPNK